MSGLHDRLLRVWYGGADIPAWLLLLERAYAAALALRRRFYARGWLRSERLSVPVVVVGNISVGGTGKTPLTIWLARELAARGWRPGVIMRGYGGSSSGPLRVQPDTDARLCGDEALLIARALSLPVAIAQRRAAAGRMLIDEAGCDVLVSDDGLQHWALARDFEIAVIDAARGLGNGHLLPGGPLRESAERLARVDVVVANGLVIEGLQALLAQLSAQPDAPAVFSMRVRGHSALSLSTPGEQRELVSFGGHRVHAVAGIGHPERFFSMLEGYGLIVQRHPFPDHHAFQAGDLQFGDDAPVLMTEKDAVKCRDLVAGAAYVVPVEAEVQDALAQMVHSQLRTKTS